MEKKSSVGQSARSLAVDQRTEGDFDVGVSALVSGDYPKAFAIFLDLAERGDPHAQSNLGFMYQTGTHIRQDIPTALKWY